MKTNKLRPLVILIIALSYSSWLAALSDDTSKPLNINADSAEIDDARGISTYLGNVEITQGSMRLTGDKVILETSENQVKKLTSEGNLATFKQTNDDGKTINAVAKKMVYTISKHEIVLTDSAKLTEACNTFESDQIIFDTEKEIVNAGSASGKDRVSITVFPEDASKNTTDCQ